jgi:hypothetical protein
MNVGRSKSNGTQSKQKTNMKKISTTVISGLAAALLLAFVATARASDKEVTITGDGMCGKCTLKETKKCQNVIQTETNGKKVNYYLVDNSVSKDFHENLCKDTKKVTATGTVKEVNGKMEMTASKLELVK